MQSDSINVTILDGQSLAEAVLRFKGGEKHLFPAILEYYNEMKRNWFRHIARRVKIDSEEFSREFEKLLHNALVHYDPDRKDSKFNNYLSRALKMKINDLIRTSLAKKNAIHKNSVSFSLKKHDLADERPVYSWKYMEIDDSIDFHIKSDIERALLRLKIAGYSINEVCTALHLSRREYWTKMDKLKVKALGLKELACP